MDTYRIAIDTFIAETFECRASVCAIFTGADIAFQDVQLHTRRDKRQNCISWPEAQRFPFRLPVFWASRSWYSPTFTLSSTKSVPKRAEPSPLTFSKSALVKTEKAA